LWFLSAKEPLKTAINLRVQAAVALAAFTYPGHIVHYAPGMRSVAALLALNASITGTVAVFKDFLLF
jgi:hypothetical protein